MAEGYIKQALDDFGQKSMDILEAALGKLGAMLGMPQSQSFTPGGVSLGGGRSADYDTSHRSADVAPTPTKEVVVERVAEPHVPTLESLKSVLPPSVAAAAVSAVNLVSTTAKDMYASIQAPSENTLGQAVASTGMARGPQMAGGIGV